MKILIVGLGSMGKRRIRLLQQSHPEVHLIGIDYNLERCNEAAAEFKIQTASNLDKVLEANRYDCAFISSSPLSHAAIIHQCLMHNIHIFTELNLTSEKYIENINLAKEQNNVLFLSSTFLYRKEVKYIKQIVRENNKRYNYNYHIGQYLPDWHPWESFKNFFVGKKETNGCREIFAIELPWLVDVFGDILHIKTMKRKQSQLEISFEDTYVLIIEHESGCIGTLNVNVVSPKAVRKLELWGENIYISWMGNPDTLEIYDSEKKEMKKLHLYEEVNQLKEYSNFIIENAYYEEIENFLNSVKGFEVPVYSFEKDLAILNLIDRIENNEEF